MAGMGRLATGDLPLATGLPGGVPKRVEAPSEQIEQSDRSRESTEGRWDGAWGVVRGACILQRASDPADRIIWIILTRLAATPLFVTAVTRDSHDTRTRTGLTHGLDPSPPASNRRQVRATAAPILASWRAVAQCGTAHAHWRRLVAGIARLCTASCALVCSGGGSGLPLVACRLPPVLGMATGSP